MFKNIGKTIQILAFVMAGLSFVGFIFYGVLCIQAAFADGVTEALQTAGIQAAIICAVLAIVSPFLCLIPYGFGTLILTSQKQAQETQKMREMLHAALSEGMLSDEIARKTGIVQSKLMTQMQAQAPQKANPRAEHAPVQRFVEEPVQKTAEPVSTPVIEKAAPVTEKVAPVAVETAPAAVESKPEAVSPAPVAPATATKPIAARPATPISGTKLLGNDEETF